jgi:hypothetical protein
MSAGAGIAGRQDPNRTEEKTVSNKPEGGSLTTTDALVSDADYVQLCRLVTEHAWRTDNGRSDTLHELWAEDGELDLGSTILRGREAIAEWGRQLVEHPP